MRVGNDNTTTKGHQITMFRFPVSFDTYRHFISEKNKVTLVLSVLKIHEKCHHCGVSIKGKKETVQCNPPLNLVYVMYLYFIKFNTLCVWDQ